MPSGDRTGPEGMGSKTGRGAGFCAGYSVPGFMNPAWGRGCGRGDGSRGWRHRHWHHATGMHGWQRAWMAGSAYAPPDAEPFAPTMTKEQKLQALKSQANYLEQALENLRCQIREVESTAEGSKTP